MPITQIQCEHDCTPRQIRDLKPGDRIDLAGDLFADPNRRGMFYDMEYCLVAAVEVETEKCTVVHFEGLDSVGFPPDHWVKFNSHDDEYDSDC